MTSCSSAGSASSAVPTSGSLITRNRGELQSYGEVFRTARKTTSLRGGRPSFEYHLNEGQALLICALPRTTMAARIRRELITVFMEYRRGTLVQPAHAPQPASAARSLTEADARKLRDAVGYFEHLAGYMRGELGEMALPRRRAPTFRPCRRLSGLRAGRQMTLSGVLRPLPSSWACRAGGSST